MKIKGIVILLVLGLSGCSIPERSVSRVKVMLMRSSAVSVKSIPKALVVDAQASPSFASSKAKEVVIIARAPGQSGPGLMQQLAPDERQEAETAAIQALLKNGYVGASRLNIGVVEMERLFPQGRFNASNLGNFFRGKHLLVLTLTRFNSKSESYSYDGLFLESSENSHHLGTRVLLNLTAELVDADSSESVWVGSAMLDALVEKVPNALMVLHSATATLVGRIPRRDQIEKTDVADGRR